MLAEQPCERHRARLLSASGVGAGAWLEVMPVSDRLRAAPRLFWLALCMRLAISSVSSPPCDRDTRARFAGDRAGVQFSPHVASLNKPRAGERLVGMSRGVRLSGSKPWRRSRTGVHVTRRSLRPDLGQKNIRQEHETLRRPKHPKP